MSGNGAQRRLGVFAVPPAAYRMPTICRVGLRANNTAALHRGRLGSRARTPAVGAATDRARRAPVRPRGGAELRRPHGECLPSARRHVRVLPPMMDDKRRRRVGRRTPLHVYPRCAEWLWLLALSIAVLYDYRRSSGTALPPYAACRTALSPRKRLPHRFAPLAHCHTNRFFRQKRLFVCLDAAFEIRCIVVA